jgi:hypothetical protein
MALYSRRQNSEVNHGLNFAFLAVTIIKKFLMLVVRPFDIPHVCFIVTAASQFGLQTRFTNDLFISYNTFFLILLISITSSCLLITLFYLWSVIRYPAVAVRKAFQLSPVRTSVLSLSATFKHMYKSTGTSLQYTNNYTSDIFFLVFTASQ